MTILPLITRELRVRSRQRTFYWLRVAIPLVGILFLFPSILNVEHGRPSHASSVTFETLVLGLFFLCSCAGVLTASAIVNERRDGTLGLLFLTKVNAFDVMIAAFGSAGLFSFCALISFVPLIMLPVLGGGVSGAEAFRKTLVLIDTLLLALAFGLWTPSRGQPRLNNSWIAVLSFWLFLCVYPLSPAFALLNAGDKYYHSARFWFWFCLGFDALLAGVLFLHASVCLRRSVKEDCRLEPQAISNPPNQSASSSPPQVSGGIVDPVRYLLLHHKAISRALWFAAILGFSWRFGTYFLRYFIRPSILYAWWGLGFVSATIQTAIFAWAASRFFLEARRNGSLEILLTTPAGAREVVSGQWRALKQMLRGPLILLLCPLLFRLAATLLLTPYSGYPSGWSQYWIATATAIALDLASVVLAVVAVIWVGMSFGLRAPTPASAIVYPVLITRVVPYFMTMAAPLVSRMFPMLYRAEASLGVWISVLLQFAAIAFYIIVIAWAKRSIALHLAHTEPAGFAARRLALLHS